MRNKSIKKILTFHNIKSHKCKETVINNYKWNNHIYSKYTQLLITRKKKPNYKHYTRPISKHSDSRLGKPELENEKE